MKDHKPLTGEGLYKTRPVSNCIGSISEPLADLVVYVLDNTMDIDPEVVKRSTEEQLEHLMRINDISRTSKEVKEKFAASMDVSALFVEIKPDKAAEEVYQSIVESPWTYECSASEMGKYISVNWSRDQIKEKGLDELIPFRTRKKESGPDTDVQKNPLTMASKEMNRSSDTDRSDGKWSPVSREPTAKERKKLVGATLAIATQACLQNHCFKHAGVSFAQGHSGVIGLDLMRCVALLYMNRWIKKFKAKLAKLSADPVVIHNDIAKAKAETVIEGILDRMFMNRNDPTKQANEMETETNETQPQRGETRTKGQNQIKPIKSTFKPEPPASLTNKKATPGGKKETQRTISKPPKKGNKNKKKKHEVDPGQKLITVCVAEGIVAQKQIIRYRPTQKDRDNHRKLLKEIEEDKKEILQGLNLVPDLLSLYVDDQFIVGNPTPEGLFFNKEKGRLEWSTTQLEKDEKIQADERSVKLLSEIANSIDTDIQLTYDAPSMNTSGKMPLLDTGVWMEKSEGYQQGKIMFSHYRKPMASNLTIQVDSALTTRSKYDIMSQEIFRIMRNTHHDVEDKVWKGDISDFMQRMKNSGWPEDTRRKIVKKGLTGWFKVVERYLNGEIPLYRHFNYNREKRDKEKDDKRTNWHKSKKEPKKEDADKLEGVIIIDATPDEEVKKIVEKALEGSKLTKIRVVERPGPKHKDALMATNKTERVRCEKPDCLICKTEKGGDCRKKEIVYQLKCKTCNSEVMYTGETGRNGYTRGREHLRRAASSDPDQLEKSVIWRHELLAHNGEKADWEMVVHRAFPKCPLDRKICEGRTIGQTDPSKSLNGKMEYNKTGLIRCKFTSDAKDEKEVKEIVKVEVTRRRTWLEKMKRRKPKKEE